MHNQSRNPLFGIYIIVNMLLAILAVPYFTAAIISGYIEFMSLKWVAYTALGDLLVLGVISSRLLK